MGQYHRTVCLDLREFIDCHALGDGLKLAEQIGGDGGVASALVVLLAASNGRGGGDLPDDPLDKGRVVGRWAGRRIAIVGDYAEDGDYPMQDGDTKPSGVYGLCHTADEKSRAKGRFRDITPLVRSYMERMEYAYVGNTGWVRRYALWSAIEDIAHTHAGAAGRIVVSQTGRSYHQPDVLAALAQLPVSTKTPVSLATLERDHGLRPIERKGA